jgi:succinate dehydrogenase / fumarate reductase cytochrome b subunit
MTEASPGLPPRPLSPFTTIWRWHLTMFTSIAHRVTGVGLYFGALIAAGWAVALASGPEAYGWYMGLLGSVLGKLVLFGITVALFYHLANGIRHLVWDAGHGLDIRSANLSSAFVIAFSITAAIGLWVIAAINGLL